jgi:hypothetical protein
MLDILTLIMSGYAVTIFTVILSRFLAIFRSKREEKKSSSKFFEALDKKFDSELVKDQSDIEIHKSAIERETGTVYSLAPLLEDYLVYLGERGSQESQLSQRYQLIKDIIASENADKPYADIPKEERRLLIAMRDAIEHEDKGAMSFNLNELSSVISTSSRVYERVLKANRWTRLLAILAIVVAVFFGMLALFY